MKNFHKFMASGFGVGWLPVAPGTWGAAEAVLLLVPFQWINISPSPHISEQAFLNLLLSVFIVFFTWIGVKAVDALEKEWGNDPKQVVIDEMVGVWIAVLGFPVTAFHLIAGFILFRFFDIAKPLGIRKLEALPGGWGVMLDDVMAGVYANIVLQIIVFFVSKIQ